MGIYCEYSVENWVGYNQTCLYNLHCVYMTYIVYGSFVQPNICIMHFIQHLMLY